MKRHAFFLLFLLVNVASGDLQAQSDSETLGDRFRQLTLQNEWKLVSRIPLKFNAHHTQGMVKVGEDFYMTAVEVKRWPRRYEEKQGIYDRDTGEGIGHLFKFNSEGQLLKDVILGEGTVYHPGGLDFDGLNLWIPVCEYRPFGPSVVYRVDIETLAPLKVFSFPDALGALAFDRKSRTLLGANWGSRDFYKWRVDRKGRIKNTRSEKIANSSFYIDYQDCHSVEQGLMLCSGLKVYSSENTENSYPLGGLDLLNTADLRPVHQLPVNLRSEAGRVITNNPAWLEMMKDGIRAYFVPDDDLSSVLYVYEVSIGE